MRTKLISIIVIFLFTALQMVGAKPKVLLRLNLEKGDHYEMTMAMDNNIDQEMQGQKIKILQKIEMVSSYKVLEVLADKNYVIEYSFERMKLNMDLNGQQTVIDSESAEDNAANKAIKNMSDLKLKVTMNSLGKVQKVEGMEEYVSKVTGNAQLAQHMEMFRDENTFKTFIEQSFSYFPESEVEVGSKWTNAVKMPMMMNMDLVINFEVADILADQVVLKMVADMNADSPIEANGMKMNVKMTGQQTGTMTINRKVGLGGIMDMNQAFDLLMKMNNPQSGEEMEFPMKMNSVTKITMVKV